MTLLRRALDAAVNPMNLVAPGMGIVTAGGLLALGVPPLALAAGALSIAAWGAMVAWDLASASPDLPEGEPPPRLHAFHLQQAMQEIRRSAQQVRQRVTAHDGVLTSSLLEVQADCDGLVESAELAASRADALHQLLGSHDPEEIARERDALRQAAEASRDEQVAASLLGAADAKARELDTWGKLRDLHDRIAAELVALAAALDEIEVRVVHLTLQDPADAAMSGARVTGDMQALGDRIRVLERSAAATLLEVT